MNCAVNYKDKEAAVKQKMAAAEANKKTAPVTGRMTKCGPTQTLQECVGRSSNSVGVRTRARQLVGLPRIQTRLENLQKGRNPIKSQ
jgi:hypothetical protein